ncbi:MAG: hypothetical protein H7177_06835 [Rhizobacter sp.]|nr:hypothetical protein [Bacteriovorax sp.]
MAKKKKKASFKKLKSAKVSSDKNTGEGEFGGITVLKTGATLAAILMSNSSNGMSSGPIY